MADEIFRRPVIIYEHPKEAKPFYVRVRDDGKTVSAFDIVAPKVSLICPFAAKLSFLEITTSADQFELRGWQVGVLVRGSQKEERINKIRTR